MGGEGIVQAVVVVCGLLQRSGVGLPAHAVRQDSDTSKQKRNVLVNAEVMNELSCLSCSANAQ